MQHFAAAKKHEALEANYAQKNRVAFTFRNVPLYLFICNTVKPLSFRFLSPFSLFRNKKSTESYEADAVERDDKWAELIEWKGR